MSPGSKVASDTSATALTSPGIFVMARAWRMTAASPTTSGRQVARTWLSASALVTISGPVPAGSPIVIASTGLGPATPARTSALMRVPRQPLPRLGRPRVAAGLDRQQRCPAVARLQGHDAGGDFTAHGQARPAHPPGERGGGSAPFGEHVADGLLLQHARDDVGQAAGQVRLSGNPLRAADADH